MSAIILADYKRDSEVKAKCRHFLSTKLRDLPALQFEDRQTGEQHNMKWKLHDVYKFFCKVRHEARKRERSRRRLNFDHEGYDDENGASKDSSSDEEIGMLQWEGPVHGTQVKDPKSPFDGEKENIASDMVNILVPSAATRSKLPVRADYRQNQDNLL
ncbi:hypothetical protein R1flu_016222 [Riccia fluitans]|uniref:Uncharacterized protein n=1 Tax=Riccia fluitans TaxID=41844 RepID=A0ABD1YLP1_9MARC